MKKFIKYSFILLAGLISSNALAEWTIPGSQCVVSQTFSSRTQEVTRGLGTIGNPRVRPSGTSPSYLQVVCSSPAHIGYGAKLDIDFLVDNQSEEQALTCRGTSYSADNQPVHVTAEVSTGKGRGKMTARQINKFEGRTPVTLRVICDIPDRGVNARYITSRVVSIRVY